MHVPILDEEGVSLEPYLASGVSFIDQHVQAGQNILVSCKSAKSRSASFVIAYLMWKQGTGFDETLAKVKAIRKIVDPNKGFQEQLRRYGE